MVAVIRLLALGGSGDGDNGPSAEQTPDRSPQLARGGTSVLPENLIVAFDGTPGAPGLGPIGRGSPQQVAKRLLEQAHSYAKVSKRPVYPALHLITTVVQADSGNSGRYSRRVSDKVIQRYVDLAEKYKLYLILDVQPGLSDMPKEVARLKPWLRNPNVGIALDPEWELEPGQVPGQVIGHTSAREVNEVTKMMAAVTKRMDLPDKVLVIHRFTGQMVSNADRIKTEQGVDTVLTTDGVGSPELKQAKYDQLAPQPSTGVEAGFKLFYEEDETLLSPKQVLGLSPTPSFVSYE